LRVLDRAANIVISGKEMKGFEDKDNLVTKEIYSRIKNPM